MLAYVFALTGLGLGLYITIYPEAQVRQRETPASDELWEADGSSDIQFKSTSGHPIIGLIVIGAFIFQPIGGLIHHYMYKKYPRRTMWAITHVWWGRIILTLGMINGGLGLMMSGYHQDTHKGEIAYGVIAGTMWLIWMAFAVRGHLRSKGAPGETGEKALGSTETEPSPERYNVQFKAA